MRLGTVPSRRRFSKPRTYTRRMQRMMKLRERVRLYRSSENKQLTRYTTEGIVVS